MTVTASAVKELREMTGAAMMDCKNALVEANGDMEAAKDLLRKRGLKLADKKAGRDTQEGLVGVHVTDNVGVMVTVNCETDFVTRNTRFQKLVDDILHHTSVASSETPNLVTEAIAEIGENIQIGAKHLVMLQEGEQVATYVHNKSTDSMGGLAVMMVYRGDDAETARRVAMHIASAKPQAVNVDQLDPEWVAKEKAFLMEQARETGKPEEIIEKMISGRMQKVLREVTLVDQPFVVDPDKTVGAVLDEHNLQVVSFVRCAIGE